MSNFAFLESHWADLAKLGDLSDKMYPVNWTPVF